MATVTIVGSGMMGSALAFPARENGHEVRLVGTHLDTQIITACKRDDRHPKFTRDFPPGIDYFYIEELEAALEGADLVIGGVNSFGVSWFADHVLPKVADETLVLSVTKGLLDTEEGELLTYPEVWNRRLDELGKRLRVNAVGGPCTSYELVAQDQTTVAFCGQDLNQLRKIKEIMATSYYHISLSTDVIGIESAVAMKNAYALGVALTIGMNQAKFGIDSELHYNSQAAAFAQGAKEMYHMLRLQGVEDLNNLWVGIGDLYVTVYGGRTRLAGILLGRGLTLEETTVELEGVTLESLVVVARVARALKKRAKRGEVDLADYPLLSHVDRLMQGDTESQYPWSSFTFEQP